MATKREREKKKRLRLDPEFIRKEREKDKLRKCIRRQNKENYEMELQRQREAYKLKKTALKFLNFSPYSIKKREAATDLKTLVKKALEKINKPLVECSICSCLLYTSPSPRDRTRSRMPSSA